ncbi:MAG: hypothetical protein IJ269_03000 [Bacteroidales bacterium]|nr:hypothetical protein [Bacteroidales bacterium]
MTIEQLTNMLQDNISRPIIDTIVNTVCEGDIDVNDIFLIMKTTNDDKVRFHAAWLLQKLFEKDTRLLGALFIDLLKLFPNLRHIGQKRTLAKIIVVYLEQTFKDKNIGITNEYFKNYDWDPIIESLFDTLIKRDTPPGLKVVCGYGLAYLSFRYEWIKDELIYQMQSQLNSQAMITGNNKVNIILSKKCCKTVKYAY